jgi:hypothetical protein
MSKPTPAPKPAPSPDTWRPYKPGFEVNDLGQLRTVGYQPGNVPTLPLPAKKPAP